MRVRRDVLAFAVIVLTGACLSACVELKVEPDTDTLKADTLPRSDSLTYNLSETTITVTGSVTLNDCDSVVASAKLNPPEPTKESATAVPLPSLPLDAPPLDISENFTVSAATQADPHYQYQIPFKKLESWTKQLNLVVARNPNKTLVSINGTITDQAGPTILAAAQAAIAIGGALAVPEVSQVSVTASAVRDQAGAAASPYQKQLLEEMGDQAVTPKSLPMLLDLKSAKETTQWEKFFNEAARIVAVTAMEARKAAPYCSKDIHKALEQIADQHKLIAKANTKPSDEPAQGKAPTDSAAGPPPPDPTVSRAQARIAAIAAEYHLTRQFTLTWTPSRADLMKSVSDHTPYILTKKISLLEDIVSPYWLSSEGYRKVMASSDQGLALSNLKKPLVLQLFIRPWTVGRDYAENTVDGRHGTSKHDNYRSGIVYRDPALSTLRICMDVCGGTLKPGPAGASAPTSIAASVVASDDLDNDLVETTGDVSAPMAVPIVQLGRFYVQPLRNVLFQTSVASLSVGVDGSITSVGTQSSSAGAAGFTAAGGAANAQASAIAAHNTAGAAQTAASTAAATYADTVNKALADCLAQQAAIVKAGGKPVPCQ